MYKSVIYWTPRRVNGTIILQLLFMNSKKLQLHQFVCNPPKGYKKESQLRNVVGFFLFPEVAPNMDVKRFKHYNIHIHNTHTQQDLPKGRKSAMKRSNSPIEFCAYQLSEKQSYIAKKSLIMAKLEKLKKEIDELKNK